ncbi:SEC12-like protein 2 [Hordeum vulgare]|nr:SEC12-like protein 2 [Hordeum vulgare]
MYEYPPPPAFSRRCGTSWTRRRMEMVSSSSSGSRTRCSGLPALLPVKPEQQKTPLGRHTRSSDIVINEHGASSRLVKTKTEPTLLPIKQEHLAMAADDEITLKCTRDDYVREEMEHQRHTLEEIAARCRSREEDNIVILDESDEEVPRPSDPVRHGDLLQGCSKDNDRAQDDDGDDDGDYTNFYKLLDMLKAAEPNDGRRHSISF